jgi:hypothetical protein
MKSEGKMPLRIRASILFVVLSLGVIWLASAQGPGNSPGVASSIRVRTADPTLCIEGMVYQNSTDGTIRRCHNGAYSIVGNVRRSCTIIVGSDGASVALGNTDVAPQGRQCFVPATATVLEVTVAADAGTPNVIVDRNRAGSTSDLTSAALATASAGGIACSNTGGTTGLDGATTCSATLQNTGLNAGDWLETRTSTAGGTAKRMTISITYAVFI